MTRFQRSHEVVDCSGWALAHADEPSYPEGSREKEALRAPATGVAPFLLAGHRYLFKLSDPRYPAQFWGEVFAYRLGMLIGVTVPPAHVALRGDRVGALIEWFYGEATAEGDRRPVCTLGGEFMLQRDPEYDREKGIKPGHCHNLDDLTAILAERNVLDWQADLTRMLVLDVLIGGADRHHDNWGIVETWRGGRRTVRMTPAFDNGTSLGHERQEARLPSLVSDERWVERHATGAKARHHLRLHRQDAKGAKYFTLLADWFEREPSALEVARRCATFDEGDVVGVLAVLSSFSVPVPLSPKRAQLMARIVLTRRRLLEELVRGSG